MTEDLLAYIWANKLYKPESLRTTRDELVEVISAGQLNRHGGPDFHHAMVRVGGRLWAGHVELHVKSSDWNQHGHELDGHYNNVILHVVFEHDVEITNQRGQPLPTLELKHVISPSLIQRYAEWQSNAQWIPCDKYLGNGRVPRLTWSAVLDRMSAERLEDKARILLTDLRSQKGDWMIVFLRSLSRSLGFRTNAEAMTSLAERLPWHTLLRLREDPMQLEALIFGMAGMLEGDPEDEYHAGLMKQYRYMQIRSGYNSLDPVIWQWGRVRPSNLPSIRLAQLSVILSKADDYRKLLFDQQVTATNMSQITIPEVTSYWHKHHRFGKNSSQDHSMAGKPAIQSILINTVAPLWFAYGLENGRQDFLDKAIELLQLCSAETNSIIRNWRTLGVQVERAHDSQALIHLFHHYCSRKRCLRCGVGLKLLKES